MRRRYPHRRYRRHLHIGAIIGVLFLMLAVLHFAHWTGFAALTATPQPASTPGNVDSTPGSSSSQQSATCHVKGSGELVLPDTSCTPGAVDASYTKAMLCRGDDPPRPPESVTEPQKQQDIGQYGDYEGSSPSVYELDHLVPLELGGAPDDSRNLWPEYDKGVIPNVKDRVEDASKQAVCSGRMPLATAQQDMATNWIDLAKTLRVSV